MPLQSTSGTASSDAFGGGAAVEPVYIEQIFSTYLYTGNGSTQTITNGIDLSTKGGMTWLKSRGVSGNNFVFDTARSATNYLVTNTTAASAGGGTTLTAFNTDGFSLGSSTSTNNSGATYASWTFREQPKFFDVVTYTGDGAGSRNVSHSLGSAPGCVIIKATSTISDWGVWHRGNGGITDVTGFRLNGTNAAAFSPAYVSSTMTATTFDPASVFPDSSNGMNTNGVTYVAYIFAHNAGGFGLTGTDNVISCGSFTTDGSGNATVNLGYEPQWVMYKSSSTAGGAWQIFDSMRGLTMGADNTLSANATTAEGTGTDWLTPSATGFSTVGAVFYTSATYIYIAIRRGPMKVPTSGTSVYSGVARTGTGAAATVTGVGFSPDLIIGKPRTGFAVGTAQFDRLRGTSVYLAPSWTDAEITDTTMVTSFNMDGVSLGADTVQKYFNGSGGTYANWMFRRAPSFFDEVCYTGTGSATTVTHNLGVAPEMMIVKGRSGARAWTVYHSSLGATKYIEFDTSAAFVGSTRWNDTAPTSSVFTVGTAAGTNVSTETYVAYLFATCAGVSKVGSYTGTGTTLQVNCGFTGGARFVLIKRTDATGDWYVWDSARGIVAGNDPYLLLNSTAAEVTTTDYIDTYSAGFEISSTAPAAINASGGTFIFLAIA